MLPTYHPVRNTHACELLDRKLFLALMSEIPNMGQYAQDWADLVVEFERIGFVHSAADCKARAVYYAKIALSSPAGWKWERNAEGYSFMNLIPVSSKCPESMEHKA